MARQVTLFDTWNAPRNAQLPAATTSKNYRPPLKLNFEKNKLNFSLTSSKNSHRSNNNGNGNGKIYSIDDDDDVIALVDEIKNGNSANKEDGDDETFLAMAMEASKIEFEIEQKKKLKNGNSIASSIDGPTSSIFTSSKIIKRSSTTKISEKEKEKYIGFDDEAGKIWIYPTNFPMRNYQFEIIQKALFYNTLVTLPTGLGKTFIAAVVMYNFYRWYPNGKVVFMAPTKPLVAQQVEACFNIMGIPQEDVAEMTGSIMPPHRKKLWNEKRVFFLTPQIINNDLQKGLLPAESVKCLVIDEAHKAIGEHAYCQVVRELLKSTKQFRVLALSATPGSDLNAVQSVLSNILIAHMELRSEDSPEIQKYTFERNIQCIVVPLTGELKELREKYEQILQNWLNKLSSQRVIYAMTVQTCSLTGLLAARADFRAHRPVGIPQWQSNSVEGSFATVIGLLHGYFLLSNMGMKSLYSYFQGKIAADKSTAVRRELNKNPELQEIHDFLKARFAAEDIDRDRRLRFPADDESFFDRSHAAAAFSTQQVTDLAATSHPKLVKLVEILIDHFKKQGSANTRVIVFAQYRDCVEEITELLKKQRPLVKPMKFVGQASSRKTSKGITQKEQLMVVSKFKEGGYNTLVSTSVGEEGLDIGEVDLIVCYDATASPVRSVQRMGRTGRKREGRIVMLVTEGKEQNVFNCSEYSKKRVHKAIVANKKFELYTDNRRMVPFGLMPECVQMLTTRPKPYENMALRKSKESNGEGGGNHHPAVKKFTGNLNELELNEWERDFKIRDLDDQPKLLEERNPLKKLNLLTEKKKTDVNKFNLNEYSLWQDRQQHSFRIQPSLLRETFVKLVKTCQTISNLSPDIDLNSHLSNSITRFCRPRPSLLSANAISRTTPTTTKRSIDRKEKIIVMEPKKKRRRLQKSKKKEEETNNIIPDSCQLIAEFKSSDFYTTFDGEQLNLLEIFPLSNSKKTNSMIRNEDYGRSDSSTRYRIPILKSKDLLDTMDDDVDYVSRELNLELSSTSAGFRDEMNFLLDNRRPVVRLAFD